MKTWKKTTRSRKRARTISAQARETRVQKEKLLRQTEAKKGREFRESRRKKQADYDAWRDHGFKSPETLELEQILEQEKEQSEEGYDA